MSAPPASNGEAPMPMFQMSNPVSVIAASCCGSLALFIFILLTRLECNALPMNRECVGCLRCGRCRPSAAWI